jgi:hypothetical protein
VAWCGVQHLSREVNNVVDFLAKLGMSRDAAGSTWADQPSRVIFVRIFEIIVVFFLNILKKYYIYILFKITFNTKTSKR